ncbi:MAG: hypothetical protein ACXWJZ_03660 [Burkholderiaceae bacterium]
MNNLIQLTDPNSALRGARRLAGFVAMGVRPCPTAAKNVLANLMRADTLLYTEKSRALLDSIIAGDILPSEKSARDAYNEINAVLSRSLI